MNKTATTTARIGANRRPLLSGAGRFFGVLLTVSGKEQKTRAANRRAYSRAYWRLWAVQRWRLTGVEIKADGGAL